MCSEGEQAFMLVVNAANTEKDWNWIKQHNTFDTVLIDISEKTGLLAVQGPKAIDALQPLTHVDLKSIKYYDFVKGTFAGFKNVLISATGYTGSGGFELYARNAELLPMWEAIFETGKPFGIQPIGLGARDTLRLEMGYALYGNDITDTTSPLEAGLGWITKLHKGDFNSSDILKKQKAEGLSRKLVAFEVNDRRAPRHDYPIEDGQGNEIGQVTSGTHSPSLDKPIGMGYVKTEFAKEGSEIFVVAGSKKLSATVVKLPFYKG
jgi:aminomethyltransferase